MKYLKKKDIQNRKSFYLFEKKKLIKKIVFINTLNSFSSLFKKKRSVFLYLLKKKLKNFINKSKTKINRRCIISNRSRSVVRQFNLSRINFKDLVYFGLIPGFKKAVW